HGAGRMGVERLDLKGAELFVEPGAPADVGRGAGLQDGLVLARAPAAHQAEMAAMRAPHHLEDGAGFAMPAGAENDSLVAPFHALSLPPLRGRNQGCSSWQEHNI